MSRIYFHSQHGDAEISGAERAYAGVMCSDLLAISLGIEHDFDYEHRPSKIRRITRLPDYVMRLSGREFAEAVKTQLVVSMGDAHFVAEGKRIEIFSTALNTALVMGTDAVKLLARLHGQCEIHAYVEGVNRKWLADIIEQGRASYVLRSDMGWEQVAELLRSRDDEPIVTSYSVCSQFPNAHVAQFEPPINPEYDEPDWDKWYELPSEERWRQSLSGLRETPLLEITPDTWATYYFQDGMNGFMLRACADEIASEESASA